MNESIYNCRDVTEASLVALTEQKLADWLGVRGRKIIRNKGRCWLEVQPGFYSSTHPMAKMSAYEATRPSTFCWGFRTSLRDADAEKANGSIPLHLLTDMDNYIWQTRTTRCRNKIRNFRKQVRIVELHRPDLLLDHGYDVLRSAHARNGYGRLPKRSEYQKNIEKYYDCGSGLVIGGLVDGKLGGYLASYAVGTTAYVDDLCLGSEYLRTNISLGLFFEWMQICRRSKLIREVVHGLHAREAAGLCRHKKELGLSVVHVPVRIWFAPLTNRIVKQLRPHAYYRLIGHD